MYKIEKGAFFNTHLSKVEFPEFLNSIESFAFYHNYNLKNIDLGASLKYIGNQAFEACDLQKVILPENITIGEGAFGNNAISSVVLSRNEFKQALANHVFRNNPLESVETYDDNQVHFNERKRKVKKLGKG